MSIYVCGGLGAVILTNT